MPTPMPVVNVNLAACSMRCHKDSSHGHFRGCAAFPLSIPCRPPPSFTSMVVLGECTMGCTTQRPGQSHYASCPARPVKVSCSISGTWDTWEESEVDPDSIEVRGYGFAQLGAVDGLAACRALWGVVKALVLNQSIGPAYVHVDGMRNLAIQRDAGYAAVAEEARLEKALYDAQRHSHALLPSIVLAESDGRVGGTPERRHSAAVLAACVERLIEQVGILGVAP